MRIFFTWRHLSSKPYSMTAYFALDHLALCSNVTLVLLLLGRLLALVLHTHDLAVQSTEWAYLPGVCSMWFLLFTACLR